MLETIVKAILFAAVLYIVHILVVWLVAAMGLPSVISTIIAVVLIAMFILWIIKAFGISL